MNPTQHLPAHPSAAYLRRYVCHSTPRETGWEEGMAWLVLNAPAEAMSSLEHLRNTAAETAETAALRLLAMEQGDMVPSSEIAHAARKALMEYGWNGQTFELGLIHCVEARHFEEAVALWEQHAGQIISNGNLLHTLACAATGLCMYERAIALICEAVRMHPEPADMLMDQDLNEVWIMYELFDPEPAVAQLLTSPAIRRILVEAEAGRVLKGISQRTMEEDLPAHIRPYIRRGVCSHFSPAPDCPAPIRADYFAWLENRRQTMIGTLRAVISRAQGVVDQAAADCTAE